MSSGDEPAVAHQPWKSDEDIPVHTHTTSPPSPENTQVVSKEIARYRRGRGSASAPSAANSPAAGRACFDARLENLTKRLLNTHTHIHTHTHLHTHTQTHTTRHGTRHQHTSRETRKRLNLTCKEVPYAPGVRQCFSKSFLYTRDLSDHRSNIHATRRKSLGPAASTRVVCVGIYLVCAGIHDGQLATKLRNWTGVQSKCGCVTDKQHTINLPYLGLCVTQIVVDGLTGPLNAV